MRRQEYLLFIVRTNWPYRRWSRSSRRANSVKHAMALGNSGSPEKYLGCKSSPKNSCFCLVLIQREREALATGKNKWKQKLENESTCSIICGLTEDDGHHAAVGCTKARALREALRKVWSLPEEDLFKYSGPDWLLLLLDRVNEDMKNKGFASSLASLASSQRHCAFRGLSANCQF